MSKNDNHATTEIFLDLTEIEEEQARLEAESNKIRTLNGIEKISTLETLEDEEILGTLNNAKGTDIFKTGSITLDLTAGFFDMVEDDPELIKETIPTFKETDIESEIEINDYQDEDVALISETQNIEDITSDEVISEPILSSLNLKKTLEETQSDDVTINNDNLASIDVKPAILVDESEVETNISEEAINLQQTGSFIFKTDELTTNINKQKKDQKKRSFFWSEKGKPADKIEKISEGTATETLHDLIIETSSKTDDFSNIGINTVNENNEINTFDRISTILSTKSETLDDLLETLDKLKNVYELPEDNSNIVESSNLENIDTESLVTEVLNLEHIEIETDSVIKIEEDMDKLLSELDSISDKEMLSVIKEKSASFDNNLNVVDSEDNYGVTNTQFEVASVNDNETSTVKVTDILEEPITLDDVDETIEKIIEKTTELESTIELLAELEVTNDDLEIIDIGEGYADDAFVELESTIELLSDLEAAVSEVEISKIEEPTIDMLVEDDELESTIELLSDSEATVPEAKISVTKEQVSDILTEAEELESTIELLSDLEVTVPETEISETKEQVIDNLAEAEELESTIELLSDLEVAVPETEILEAKEQVIDNLAEAEELESTVELLSDLEAIVPEEEIFETKKQVIDNLTEVEELESTIELLSDLETAVLEAEILETEEQVSDNLAEVEELESTPKLLSELKAAVLETKEELEVDNLAETEELEVVIPEEEKISKSRELVSDIPMEAIEIDNMLKLLSDLEAAPYDEKPIEEVTNPISDILTKNEEAEEIAADILGSLEESIIKLLPDLEASPLEEKQIEEVVDPILDILTKNKEAEEITTDILSIVEENSIELLHDLEPTITDIDQIDEQKDLLSDEVFLNKSEQSKETTEMALDGILAELESTLEVSQLDVEEVVVSGNEQDNFEIISSEVENVENILDSASKVDANLLINKKLDETQTSELPIKNYHESIDNNIGKKSIFSTIASIFNKGSKDEKTMPDKLEETSSETMPTTKSGLTVQTAKTTIPTKLDLTDELAKTETSINLDLTGETIKIIPPAKQESPANIIEKISKPINQELTEEVTEKIEPIDFNTIEEVTEKENPIDFSITEEVTEIKDFSNFLESDLDDTINNNNTDIEPLAFVTSKAIVIEPLHEQISFSNTKTKQVDLTNVVQQPDATEINNNKPNFIEFNEALFEQFEEDFALQPIPELIYRTDNSIQEVINEINANNREETLDIFNVLSMVSFPEQVVAEKLDDEMNFENELLQKKN